MKPEAITQKLLRNSIEAIEQSEVYDKAFKIMDELKRAGDKETILHLVYIIQSQQKIINYLDSVCPDEDQEPRVFYPMSYSPRKK